MPLRGRAAMPLSFQSTTPVNLLPRNAVPLITVSIGSYKDVKDYNDKCTVKVYDASDSVLVARGYGEYEKANGYVTAECPITITNNYHKSITLHSVRIVGNNGNSVFSPINSVNNKVLNTKGHLDVKFPKMTNIYQPKVVVEFTVEGGQSFTKEIDY